MSAPRWLFPVALSLILVTASAALAGCANQPELSQKEKDRMAREMERENRKQTQAQEKMMRTNTRTNSGGLGGQRPGAR